MKDELQTVMPLIVTPSNFLNLLCSSVLYVSLQILKKLPNVKHYPALKGRILRTTEVILIHFHILEILLSIHQNVHKTKSTYCQRLGRYSL